MVVQQLSDFSKPAVEVGLSGSAALSDKRFQRGSALNQPGRPLGSAGS